MQSFIFRCMLGGVLLSSTWICAQNGAPPLTGAPGPATHAPAVNAPVPTTTFLSEAESAMDEGNYSKAIPLLNQALERQLSDSHEKARILFDRGYAQQAQNQMTAAEADYREAIQTDPQQFESRAALGLLLAQQKQWAQARKELEVAVTLHPASGDQRERVADAARTLAHVDAVMHDAAAASDALLQALKLTPETMEDRFLAAELAEDQKNYSDAEQEYRKILEDDPKSIPAAEGLGHTLLQQQKFSEVEAALEPALAQEPNDPTLLAELAAALAGQGKPQAAISKLQALHQQNPDQPAITRMLADLLSSAGETDKAAALYQELLTDDPKNPDLLIAAGENLLHAAKWGEAVQLFQRSVNIEPEHADAWSGLAFAALENGQYSMVLTALDQRAHYISEGPATFFLRASALDHLHRNGEAISFYQKFLATAQGQYPEEQNEAQRRLRFLRRSK